MSCIEDNVVLAYTPAGGYKAGKAYSVIPSSGDGDFTVTRAADTATRVNEDGYVEPSLANTPRIDYSDGTPALLTEPQATNLLTYSEAFGNSAWTKSGATVEGDPSTAGVELVTNGDFASGATGWASGGGGGRTIDYAGDEATVTMTSAGSLTFTNTMVSNVVANNMYKVTYTIRDYSSDKPIVVYIKDGGSVFRVQSITQLSDNGTIDEYFVATHSGQLSVGNVGTIAISSVFTFDNVSVKEVQGFPCPMVDSSGDNTLQGFKLAATANDGYIRLATPLTITNAVSYSNSIYAKRVSGTGTVSLIDINGADVAKTITTEWTRLTDSETSSSTSGQIGIKLGTSGDEILIFGAQPDLGSASTSYIPTNGSSETRSADAVKTADISSTIPTEWSIFYDGYINNYISGIGFFGGKVNYEGISNADKSFYVACNTTAGQLEFAVYNGITKDEVVYNYIFGDRIKFIIDSNGAIFINGVKIDTLSFGNTELLEVGYGRIGTSTFESGNNTNVNSTIIYNLLSDQKAITTTTP